ncbi:MAG: UbiA family prenyltransferase [Candidatus Eisenbacteria bacterium]
MPGGTGEERRKAGAGRLAGWVHSVENSGPGVFAGVLVFLALVLLRNILEGVFENSRFIGFVPDAGVSALMVLDHFAIFYAALFVSLGLALSAATGFPLGRVFRVLLAGWVLILLPPIVDALVSGGRGYAITYVPNLLATAAAFFDPRSSIPEVSIGQRIEILLGILLVGGYARVRGAGVPRAIGAGALFYAVVAFFGALPVLFARASVRLGWAPAGEDPVAALFRSGGIVQHESRKHALLFLFVLLIAGTIALAKLYPRRAAAVRAHLRPLRALHYGGLALFGGIFGAVLFAPYLGGASIGSAMDVLALAALVLSVVFAFQCGAFLNDLSDVRSDRLNDPRRPLASGALSSPDVRLLAALFASAALLLAVNVAHTPFLLVIAALGLSALYSLPPLRIKRIPIAATAVLGAVSAAAFLAGFSAFAGGRAFHLAPRGILLVVLAGIASGFNAKDLKDIKGDRADRVWTLPVLLGDRRSRRLIALLVAAGFLAPALLLPVRALWLIAPPFALAGVLFVLRFARPDRPLLLLYLPYTFLVFALVLWNADRFRGGAEIESRGTAFGARRLLLQGEATAASALFEKAAARDPGADRFLHERATALARSGRFGEAVPLLRSVLRERFHDPRAWTTLSECLCGLGRSAEAREVLEAMRARRVDPAEASRRLAALSLEEGNLVRAAVEIESERMLGAREEETAVHSGDLLVLSGDPLGAIPHYEEALRFDPSSAAAWAGIGRAEHASGRLCEARAAFERALEEDSENAVFWNNAGVVLRDLGETAEALRFFERARGEEKDLVHAYMNRAGLLEAIGEEDRAADEYRLLLEAVPGFAPAINALGRLAGEGTPPTHPRRGGGGSPANLQPQN